MSITDVTPVIALPVQGRWKLIKSPGHARFAFDLIAVNDDSGKTMPPFLVAAYERWTGDRWEYMANTALQKGELVRSV